MGKTRASIMFDDDDFAYIEKLKAQYDGCRNKAVRVLIKEAKKTRQTREKRKLEKKIK